MEFTNTIHPTKPYSQQIGEAVKNGNVELIVEIAKQNFEAKDSYLSGAAQELLKKDLVEGALKVALLIPEESEKRSGFGDENYLKKEVMFLICKTFIEKKQEDSAISGILSLQNRNTQQHLHGRLQSYYSSKEITLSQKFIDCRNSFG